eukprot:1656421-Pleurochrysis_carterae.AAC.2
MPPAQRGRWTGKEDAGSIVQAPSHAPEACPRPAALIGNGDRLEGTQVSALRMRQGMWIRGAPGEASTVYISEGRYLVMSSPKTAEPSFQFMRIEKSGIEPRASIACNAARQQRRAHVSTQRRIHVPWSHGGATPRRYTLTLRRTRAARKREREQHSRAREANKLLSAVNTAAAIEEAYAAFACDSTAGTHGTETAEAQSTCATHKAQAWANA